MIENSTQALFAAPEDLHPEDDSNADLAERELARLRESKVDAIILEYLGTRDQLDAERHAWQAIENDLKARLDMMSMVLREKADSLGVDSFPVRGVATAYRNTKTSYRIADWAAFTDWLDRTKNFQCLEKRVAKLAAAEVEKALGAELPGISKVVEVEFLVRRNKS